MNDTRNIYNFTHDGLVIRLRELGQKAYRARQILNWLYEHRVRDFQGMTNIPAKFRDRLEENFSAELPEIIEEATSEDGAHKFLLELADGARIESVLITSDDRLTLCISSQVGCKFACSFCRTATMGFVRDLSPGEITGQLLTTERVTGKNIDNIVMMGMGEPLDNFENILKAMDIFTHPETLALSPRRITLSTAGIPKAMDILKKLFPRVGLSLSLNAPRSALRRELMPIENTYPIQDLIAALDKINPRHQDPITIEYVLLRGVNDSPGDAAELCNLLSGIDNIKVNLIPFNPSAGIPYERPPQETVERFQSVLRRNGIECFVRRSAGQDIGAACGQLAVKDKT